MISEGPKDKKSHNDPASYFPFSHSLHVYVYREMLKQESLYEASREGDDEKVAFLLKDWHNHEEKETYDLTSGLLFSADEGHDKVVKIYLDHGVNINTKGQQDGMFLTKTALMRAAASGHFSTVKLLLERRADLDVQDSHGTTALMRAAERNYPDIVSLLLRKGADKNLKTSGKILKDQGLTAYEIAEQNGCVNVLKIFSAYQQQQQSVILSEELYKVAQEGNSRLVRGLLVAGANLEYRDANGDQAIHMASDNGHNDVIRVLLDFGANIDSRGQCKYTPLHRAARSKQFRTVRLLIDFGADMNLLTSGGSTALIWATKKNDLRTACELVDRGADTKIERSFIDSEKTEKEFIGTALDLAKQLHYSKAIAVLLSDEKTSDDFYTAKVLFTATENANIKVLTNLLKRGASIEISNKIGESPFQIATRFPKIVKQEYHQQIETYKNSGIKPKDPIDNVIIRASKKSNEMAKLFIAQTLTHHDRESIARRVSDIVNHVKSNQSSFCGQKFYLKFSINNADETLLESIATQGLLKEREEVLDIMISNDGQEFGHSAEAEFRVMENVKNAVSSSVGLRDCLMSVQERFPWSTEKTLIKKFLSFIRLVVIGSCFYLFDVYTDIRFSQDMFAQAERNFTQERETCMKTFDDSFSEAFYGCKVNLTETTCMKAIRFVQKVGEECFETEHRFSDPSDWSIAGTVSYLHCGLAFLISIFIWWEIIETGEKCVSSIFKLPLPFITKTHKFLCEMELFENYSWSNRNDNSFTKKQYEEKKNIIAKKASSIENIVNLSLIIEASVESSFQFFFQTVYALPNIVLTFTDPSGSLTWNDLFNWKTSSILLSFISFAWAFYVIRSVTSF